MLLELRSFRREPTPVPSHGCTSCPGSSASCGRLTSISIRLLWSCVSHDETGYLGNSSWRRPRAPPRTPAAGAGRKVLPPTEAPILDAELGRRGSTQTYGAEYKCDWHGSVSEESCPVADVQVPWPDDVHVSFVVSTFDGHVLCSMIGSVLTTGALPQSPHHGTDDLGFALETGLARKPQYDEFSNRAGCSVQAHAQGSRENSGVQR